MGGVPLHTTVDTGKNPFFTYKSVVGLTILGWTFISITYIFDMVWMLGMP